MNEDIVTVHGAIMGPFIATAVSKLFSSRFSGCIKELLCRSRSSPVRFNSDAAGEGRGETASGLLILFLANDPHQGVNVDAREWFVSPFAQLWRGSEGDAELHRLVTG